MLKALTVFLIVGGTLRAYIPLRMFTALDGHQDGVPNLQAPSAASLEEQSFVQYIVNK
jgi:hypothetical protein